MRLLETLRTRIVLGDGAMGTELLTRGASREGNLSRLNVEDPGRVFRVHRDYVSAGAGLLRTNTFMASPLRMAPELAREAAREGVRIARQAAGPGLFVLGSVGPLSELPHPLSEKASAYRDLVVELAREGCDAIILETFTRVEDLELGVRSTRSVTDLPILAQMAFPRGIGNGSLLGALEALGAPGVGVNCTTPYSAVAAARELLAGTKDLPVSVFPSAGYDRSAESGSLAPGAVRALLYLAGRGVRLVGGCCGVGPEAIRLLSEGLKESRPASGGEPPRFPLSLLYENGDERTLPSATDLPPELEGFDSRRPGVLALDAWGRPVDLRISGGGVDECRVAPVEPRREGGTP